jgi:archaeal cell division control protein 6
MMHYLNQEDNIFLNRDAFEIDFVPEIFNFREAQMKEIAFAVGPGLVGNRPLNQVLRGLPGTGKTTAVWRIFSEITDKSQRLIPVYINCQTDQSKYAVFCKIFSVLHKYQPPAKGASVQRVVADIGKTLSERKVVLLVCFDDANYLLPGNILNDILNILLRLYVEHPKARVGVFLPMSTMDVDLKMALDPAVFSVLQPDDVYFPPYLEEEIREILHDRIKIGLIPGVLTDEMFTVLIDHTMRSGDMRVGLDLVKRSVMAAEREGRDTVTEEDITASFKVSRYVHMMAAINALSTEERKLLGHIAVLSLEIETIETMMVIFNYVNLSMKISISGLFEKLRKFDDMRLIEFRQMGGNGKTKGIALRYAAVKVAEACAVG